MGSSSYLLPIHFLHSYLRIHHSCKQCCPIRYQVKVKKPTARINSIFYLNEIYGHILRYLISICSYLYTSIFSGVQSA